MHNFHHHINIRDTFEMFYYFCGGIGLLLAGFGGLKLFLDMLNQWKQKRKFKNYQDKFLPEDVDKTYELFKEESGNKVYVYDLEDKKLHWIRNQHTRIEMGFDPKNYVPKSKEELNKYEKGEDIIAS